MNKLTRLTALLLAMMMLLSTFAAADTRYQAGDMTLDQWGEIVTKAEDELFVIDEGDSGKEVTPELPEKPEQGPFYPYTDGTETDLIISETGVTCQMTASGVAVLKNSTPGQWQIRIGDAWISVTGENGEFLWVTAAMMNGMTTADFRKALEPKDEQTGAYTAFTQTATVEIVKAVPAAFKLMARADENGGEDSTPAEDNTAGGQLSLQAANPDLDKYYVVINYIFDAASTSGGTAAATPYTAEVSTNKLSFSATVKHPTVKGYAPARAVMKNNPDVEATEDLPAGFVYSAENITITNVDLDGDVNIYVYYVPAENKFTVKYWEELVEYTIDSAGNDVKYEKVNETAYTGMTEAQVKNSYGDKTVEQWFATLHTPEGFRPLLYDDEIAIAADGSTEVNVYYQRLYYLMAFNLNGGQGVDPIYTKHGAEIKELGTPTKPGYAFAGWATEKNGAAIYQTSAALLQAIGGKMPTNNSMYYAVWTPADTTYTVVYWFENADSTDSNDLNNYSAVYVQDELDALTESTVSSTSHQDIDQLGNSVVNSLSEHPKHFDRNTALEADYVIAGDGTTIVNVYYTRKEYTIRFYYAARYNNNIRLVTNSAPGYLMNNITWANQNRTTAPQIIDGFSDYIGTEASKDNNHRNYTFLYYDLTAKYNAEISDQWPDFMFSYANDGDNDNSNYNGIVQNSWFIHTQTPLYRSADVKTFKGTYSRLDDAIIVDDNYNDPYLGVKDGKNVVGYFIAFWRSLSDYYSYHIWYELIEGEAPPLLAEGETLPIINQADPTRKPTATYNGKTYYLDHTVEATSGSAPSGQNPPGYVGFNHVGSDLYTNEYNRPTNDHNGDKETPFRVYFYYERETAQLQFFSNGEEIESAKEIVPYGAQMSKYIWTPGSEYAPDTYYDFGGWYTTQECIPGTEYDFSKETMPSNNILLYAKWVPHTYSVRVYNTQALADQARALYDPDNGVYPEGTVTHLYHWLKEENRGVSHGKSVSSAYDYKDQNQYDPSTGEHQDPEREGYEFLLWYYYAPDGTMQPFSFPATPITQDTFVFAVWTADALADYTIYYVKSDGQDGAVAESYYTDKANWVTDSYEGRGLPGANVTERAKGGDQLYDAYRNDGWFPTLESHSFMLELPEAGKKNVYVFEYVQANNMPYVVHYVTKQNPNNNLGTIEIGGETYYLVAESKKVEENKKAVITENYAPVSGNYVPDAFQKRLIITAGMEEKDRVIVFYYEKDESRTTLEFNHWLVHADGAKNTLYDSVKRIVDLDPEFVETLQAMTIPNYTYDASLTTRTDGNRAPVTIDNLTITIEQGAEGVIVDLYYVEDKVAISYVAVGPADAKDFGSVDPVEESNIGVVTGSPTGSTATAHENYEFAGWYRDAACEEWLSNDAKYVPGKNADGVYEAATYYAKFVEQEVTIKYVAVGPEGATDFGTVDPPGETVKVLTGTAVGSTANPTAPTFKFVGWYDNEKCTGEALSTDAHYVPIKVGEAWVDGTTYYAKFEYNLTSMKIQKAGNVAENETFIFTVKGEGLPAEGLKVMVNGTGSAIINGLTVGQVYTVTEDANWSWRYTAHYPKEQTAGLSAALVPETDPLYNQQNTVTITNTQKHPYWLDGSDYKMNQFTTN